MTAKVWVDSAYGVGKVVRMQVADTAAGNNDGHYVEAQATTTQTGWNTLVFDFANPVSRYVSSLSSTQTTKLSSSVAYDKVTMFIDWDNGYAWDGAKVGTPPTSDRTYYIDDVKFVREVPTFKGLDFSAVGYQFNGFEGASASVVTDPTVANSTNKVVKYVETASSKNYAGVSLGLNDVFGVDPITFDVEWQDCDDG